MALSTIYRYRMGPHHNASGQTVYLPGSSTFQMPQAVPDEIDIYTIDTIQKFPLGMKVCIDDWIFRYVEFGGVTAAGDVVQAEAPDGAHDDLDPTGSGSGAAVTAGSKIISIGSSITLVENEYEGGTLTVETDTGAGYSYIIEANEAVSAAADALVRIKMGLAIAIDATSDVKLVKARWKEVIQMPTTLTAALAGISVGVGADGSFGFLCTKGPWAVLTDGVVVIGQHVRASDGTAGAVEALDRDGTAEDEPELGYVVDVGPTTEFSVINVMLDS